MKNARGWYLTDWFVCTPGPQVLERVVESIRITFQPTVDRSRTSLQIHAGTFLSVMLRLLHVLFISSYMLSFIIKM
jgi:hypothetical protein